LVADVVRYVLTNVFHVGNVLRKEGQATDALRDIFQCPFRSLLAIFVLSSLSQSDRINHRLSVFWISSNRFLQEL